MHAESIKKSGRMSLWSPSNVTTFLSPANASKIILEWCGRTSTSSVPAAKRAGTKQVLAASTGRSLYKSKCALDFTVEAIFHKAVLTRNDGMAGVPTCAGAFATSSIATCSSDANGESKMIPASDGSRLACITEHAAPMLLPHSAIAVARPEPRKCCMTHARSSCSITNNHRWVVWVDTKLDGLEGHGRGRTQSYHFLTGAGANVLP
mmetsp:Transcript_35706/g.81114  ORF Transcript_35706/g.81114 Transcript_35706/m.81114 type:complete len:207 (-) Transcript_35706:469-1089(-)